MVFGAGGVGGGVVGGAAEEETGFARDVGLMRCTGAGGSGIGVFGCFVVRFAWVVGARVAAGF